MFIIEPAQNMVGRLWIFLLVIISQQTASMRQMTHYDDFALSRKQQL